jgi:hypothetical protein
MMNEKLKSRIAGKLEGLPDDMGRQLMDYLEFLESKYNRSKRAPSTVQKITEGLEDRFGSVRISEVAAKGTAQLAEAAGRVMSGLAAASKVVAEELQSAIPEPAEPKDDDEGSADAETPTDDATKEPPSADA